MATANSRSTSDSVSVVSSLSEAQKENQEDFLQGNEDSESAVVRQAKEDWIQSQLESHRIEIIAASNEEGPLTGGESLEEAQEVIAKLEEEMFEAYIEKDKRELLVKRLQMGSFLIQELFEKSKDDTLDPKEKEVAAAKARYLEALLNKQTSLTSDIMKKLKEMDSKKQSLWQLQKKNLELKVQNKKIMELIRVQEDPQRTGLQDSRTKELYDDLDNIVQKIVIARNTLQCLIVGSGINWAQDPEMQELVLKLGEKLEF